MLVLKRRCCNPQSTCIKNEEFFTKWSNKFIYNKYLNFISNLYTIRYINSNVFSSGQSFTDGGLLVWSQCDFATFQSNQTHQ